MYLFPRSILSPGMLTIYVFESVRLWDRPPDGAKMVVYRIALRDNSSLEISGLLLTALKP